MHARRFRDDMFFVDGEKVPSLKGTGAEDHVLGCVTWYSRESFETRRLPRFARRGASFSNSLCS